MNVLDANQAHGTELLTLVATLTSLVSVGVACLYTYAVLKALKHDAHMRAVDLHSRIESELRELQKKFPVQVNDVDWQPSDEQRRHLTLYWYLVFDEWLTFSVEGGDELKHFWDAYYSHGVASALRKPAFRLSLENLFQVSQFLGLKEEFQAAIREIWKSECHDAGKWSFLECAELQHAHEARRR